MLRFNFGSEEHEELGVSLIPDVTAGLHFECLHLMLLGIHITKN